MMKRKKIPVMKTGEVPKNLEEESSNTVALILECMEINNISKSAAVSAMATLIVTIFSHFPDRKNFDEIINMMRNSYDRK